MDYQIILKDMLKKKTNAENVRPLIGAHAKKTRLDVI